MTKALSDITRLLRGNDNGLGGMAKLLSEMAMPLAYNSNAMGNNTKPMCEDVI